MHVVCVTVSVHVSVFLFDSNILESLRGVSHLFPHVCVHTECFSFLLMICLPIVNVLSVLFPMYKHTHHSHARTHTHTHTHTHIHTHTHSHTHTYTYTHTHTHTHTHTLTHTTHAPHTHTREDTFIIFVG